MINSRILHCPAAAAAAAAASFPCSDVTYNYLDVYSRRWRKRDHDGIAYMYVIDGYF